MSIEELNLNLAEPRHFAKLLLCVRIFKIVYQMFSR